MKWYRSHKVWVLIVSGLLSVAILWFFIGAENPEQKINSVLSTKKGGIVVDFFVNILASLVPTVVTAVFILYKMGSETKSVHIVDSSKITSELKKEIKKSSSWSFYGASGSFQRAEVIKHFFKTTDSFDYTLILLDPTNDAALDRYATYRNSFNTDVKDRRALVKDITSTYILVCLLRGKKPQGRVKVHLTPNIPLARLDISKDMVFQTRADKSQHALMASNDCFFYGTCLTEFRVLEGLSKEVSVPAITINSFGIQNIESLAVTLGVTISQVEASEILSTIKQLGYAGV